MPLVAMTTVAVIVATTAGARPIEVADSLVVSAGESVSGLSAGGGTASSSGGHASEPSSGTGVSDPPSGESVPSLLLAGDSTAFTLAWHFGPSRRPGADWHFLATLGCGVIRGDTVSSGRTWRQRDICKKWPQQWATWSETWHVDLAVVQVGAWEVLDVRVDGETLRVGTPEHSRYLAGELEDAIGVLSAGGARVVFLKVPCFGPSPDGARLGAERTDVARVEAVNAVIDSVVAAHPERAEVLDSAAWLCPGGRYVDEIGGVRVRYDGVHFDAEGADAFWAWLAPKIEALATTAHRPGFGVR